MDDFAPKYLDKLLEDMILDGKTKASLGGDVEYLRIGFKEMHPSKARQMEKEKVRDKFSHFPIN